MSGGRRALRLRQRRPPRHLPRRLAHGGHGQRPRRRRAARSTGTSGNGKFEDVTDKAGVGHPGWAMGVCTADVDGDGWRGHLRHRPRAATTSTATTATARFTDVAEKAGVTGGGWSTGCGFADYDRDGHLDLFVSRYVKIDLATPARSSARGRRARRGATCSTAASRCSAARAACPGEADLLFRNDGNGHFTEVSDEGRRQRPARVLRPRRRLVRLRTATAGPTSTWPTTRTRTSST